MNKAAKKMKDILIAANLKVCADEDQTKPVKEAKQHPWFKKPLTGKPAKMKDPVHVVGKIGRAHV